MAAVRLAGKPFVVSEYNHPFPSYYDAEMIPLAAAYAARQDWDALVFFDYTSTPAFGRDRISGFFEVEGHPVKTAQMLAGSAILARGDVAPSGEVTTVAASSDAAFASAGELAWWDVHIMLANLSASMPAKDERRELHIDRAVQRSAAGKSERDFEWSSGDETGTVSARSERSEAVVGFIGGERLVCGWMTAEIETSFAAVTATSLDGKPLESSSRILLTACGRSGSTGMKWNEAADSLESWGTAPSVTEGIQGKVVASGRYAVFALDAAGVPTRRIDCRADGNRTFIELDPRWRTVWYLLTRMK